MAPKKQIPYERGTYEYERERSLRKKAKHASEKEWRLIKLLDNARHRAKLKQMEFNLTHEFLVKLWDQQNGCCALTGVPFDLEMKILRNQNSPSIDRINSSEGYLTNNIRLTTSQVNIALNMYGEEEFLKMCYNAVKHYEGTVE